MKHSERFLALVGEARKRIRETQIQDVKRLIDKGEKFHLVDVREREEWEKGRLPGAVHLSKGTIERDIETAIPDLDAPIVLYCGGGYRSALAADSLSRMGYRSVLSMDGGWRAWTEAGFPIAR